MLQMQNKEETKNLGNDRTVTDPPISLSLDPFKNYVQRAEVVHGMTT
jgi:hypothetical protein